MKRKTEFRYSKLAAILKEQILSGAIKPGEFLMSENELSSYYNISRTSVRKCLEELHNEGLIEKRPGQGTIVSPNLVLPKQNQKVLRIFTTFPSFFIETSMNTIIEDFERQHPNVAVKLLQIPRIHFWDAFQESRDMGLQPDLIFIADTQFREMSEQIGDFANLQDILADTENDIYPKLISAFKIDNQLKALPVTFSTVYLAYNADLFDKHGLEHPHPKWTNEDFIQSALALTQDTNNDGIADQYGFSLASSVNRWFVFAMQHLNDPKTALSQKQLASTLTYMHDLLYKKRIAALFHPHMRQHPFTHRKTAMTLTTSIEMAGWRNQGLDFETKVAPLPFSEHKSTLLVANAFMLPETAENPDLARLFLAHCYKPHIQQDIFAKSRFLSVFHSMNQKMWDPDFLKSLNVKDIKMENSYLLHQLFPTTEGIKQLELEMELYWAGLESAEYAAERLAQILDKYK